MGRPHTEFIQAQCLEWVPESGIDKAWRKVLSRDGETGAMTLLQRLEPDFHFANARPIAAGEEFYVLAGSYYLNGYEYSAGCYGFYPAGHERRECYSPRGAVLLRFFDAGPINAEDDPDTGNRALNRPAIPFVDAYRMVWDRGTLDHRLAHLLPARKVLRIDPVDGQKTFLFMTAPQTHPTNWAGPQESHPTPEEAFLVAGDLTGPQGTMQAGAYFWRPPHIPHGPFGSRAGSLSLIRFVGGAHENIWTDDVESFTYSVPYRPVLPEALRESAAALPLVEPW